MPEEASNNRPTKKEADARYEHVKGNVQNRNELSRANLLLDIEKEPPLTLFTGTGLNYAREMISRFDAFRHIDTQVYFSENFPGAASYGIERATRKGDQPIVLVVNTRIEGVNAKWKKMPADTHFVADQIPTTAIIKVYKVKPNEGAKLIDAHNINSLEELDKLFEGVEL
jgi:hypothetical protein